MRNREVDIVASEKQVVADGDSLDVRNCRSGLGGDLKKCEIGCAAADVNNQDVMGAAVKALSPNVAAVCRRVPANGKMRPGVPPKGGHLQESRPRAPRPG